MDITYSFLCFCDYWAKPLNEDAHKDSVLQLALR
jgi:hypothetical protein